MATVKSLDRISKKWLAKSQNATQEYADGVANPRRSWSESTKAAEGAYEQGVQAAIARKAFGKGVTAAGDEKWQKNATEKGPARFASGVALAQSSYESGFAPYRAAIEGLTLPPRGAKGDPKNIDRVRAVADVLHKTKIERAGR
jgi:hypothetical protein